MRDEIRKVREEQERKDKERKETEQKLRERIEALEDEARETRAALRRAEDREEENERRKRKNNILIKGLIVEGTRVTPRSVEEFLARELQVQGKVIEAYWNRNGNQGKGMIVAKLEDWETKQEIMREKSQLGNKKIYIDNDLTPKERAIQRQIGDRAKEEKQKGNTTKIGYMKLTINRKKYEWIEGEGLQEVSCNLPVGGLTSRAAILI